MSFKIFSKKKKTEDGREKISRISYIRIFLNFSHAAKVFFKRTRNFEVKQRKKDKRSRIFLITVQGEKKKKQKNRERE
jgi:hypothetical protein